MKGFLLAILVAGCASQPTSGTVSVVNITGAKVCYVPDGVTLGPAQEGQVCGSAFTRPDQPTLAIGQHITVTTVTLPSGDALVIEPK